MPTYTFTRTLDQMRALVLRKLRYLDPTETPSADDAATVDEAINLRLKELHALGVLWFKVAGATTDLAIVGGTATKSLSGVSDFLFPVSLSLRIGTEDRDIEIISHREYQAIPTKADSGEPEKAAFRNGTAYFWPTPDDDYTAKLTYEGVAADVDSAEDLDIPVAMMRSLVTLVAADCCDDFAIPEERVIRLKAEAERAELTLRRLNSERVDTTTVEVDYF